MLQFSRLSWKRVQEFPSHLKIARMDTRDVIMVSIFPMIKTIMKIMQYNSVSNEWDDREISSAQDEEIQGNPVWTEEVRLPTTENNRGGLALIGNRGTVSQEEDNPETTELKRECHRHPQLDGKFSSVDYVESQLDGTIVAKCWLLQSEKNIRGTLKVLPNFSTHVKVCYHHFYFLEHDIKRIRISEELNFDIVNNITV